MDSLTEGCGWDSYDAEPEESEEEEGFWDTDDGFGVEDDEEGPENDDEGEYDEYF